MFQLELIELLNKYRNLTDEFEKNKLLKSISNLINENPKEYAEFVSNPAFDLVSSGSMEILKLAEGEILKEKENIESEKILTSNTVELVKNAYLEWEREFELNDFKLNDRTRKIVEDLVNRFAETNLEVLLKILEIKDSENYEKFKNLIKFYLRKYFVLKIKAYRLSDEFNKLGFFKKWQKKKKIFEVYSELGKFKFNIEKIKEVLK